ncbi:hypothetical protein M5K25_016079 [Dendrobium thyrsiflorum]|uniref:Uncharacterized protein n=1 Tax=Dendrobium thyrsiflorum TaxID=117978 RepID=A0ABD0USE3_DENTH
MTAAFRKISEDYKKGYINKKKGSMNPRHVSPLDWLKPERHCIALMIRLLSSSVVLSSFNALSSEVNFWKADGFVDNTLPRDFALISRGLYDLNSVYHLALKADGGGMDDRPDQDPMVPSSRVIVVPSLLRFNAVGELMGSGHDRNLVVPFGGEPPGSEGPES